MKPHTPIGSPHERRAVLLLELVVPEHLEDGRDAQGRGGLGRRHPSGAPISREIVSAISS
jgi:hypothetical protein